MSAVSVLSSVISRIEDFCQEGAPATCGDGYKERLKTLVSLLCQVKPLFEGRTDDVNFNKQVVKLAYDIEDAVEREALVEQDGHVSSQGGKLKNWLILNGCSSLLESDFRRLEKRIDELIKRYGPVPAPKSGTISLKVLPGKDIQVETDIVGQGKLLSELAESIDGGHLKTYKTVIYGVAGVGKTVLAKQLFNHQPVKKRFGEENRLFIHASGVKKGSDIVKSMLEALKQPISEMGLEELIEQLKNAMKGERYLVILDDIRSNELWESIQHAFPEEAGIKVVVTTRARIISLDECFKTLIVPCLTDTESNELLTKKLELEHQDPDNINVSLRSTLDTIISMCHGLPQEIIRISNILKTQIKNPEKWEDMVRKEQASEIKDTSIFKSIALSYDSLDPAMKSCFLYLGQFPPHQPISIEKLHLIWKAERFIVPGDDEDHSKDLEEKYLMLVTRDKVFTEKQVSCQFYDMTRKFCRLQVKAEDFGGVSDRSIATCRVPIYLNEKGHDILPNIHVVKHIRALLFFGDNDSRLLSQWSGKFDDLERFECTRVLDFDKVDLRANKLSTRKCKLLHLRYLSFAKCYLEEFPFSLWEFPFIETLDLRVETKMSIPNVISKMSNLLHLYFPLTYKCNTGGKLKLNGAKKLKVIENFHADTCDVDDLLVLKNLESVKVISDGKSINLKKLISNIREIYSKLGESQRSSFQSSLVLKDFDCYSSKRQDTFKELLEYDGIKNMYLEGFIGKMPDLEMANCITHIVFDGTGFLEDPMPILGKIHSLKSLVLCNDAISVKEISCCGQTFEKLISFEINNLRSLMLWVLEIWSMQTLKVLTIKQCHNLVALPRELIKVNMNTLRQINIDSMSEDFMKKVEYKVNNPGPDTSVNILVSCKNPVVLPPQTRKPESELPLACVYGG